jgi:cellulose biosynthesis protein BcsQ
MKNVVLFFSYKGGVGRSINLLSTAIIAAGKYNKKIGVVDADVEAPSLHLLLNIKLKEEQQNLLKILYKGASALKIKEGSIFLRDVLPEGKKEKLGNGEIYLFPCLPGVELVFLNPISEKERENLVETLEEFLTLFFTIKGLNYIFIDCKAGISGWFDILASYFAEIIILNFRIDQQNLDGIKRMLPRLEKARKGLPLILVATQFPTLSNLGRNKLASFEKEIKRQIDIVIPFDERLIFGDAILPLETDFLDPVCAAYEEIVKKIIF